MAIASKALILTLPPDILGGVATKAKIMADFLRDAGCNVTIAFYATRQHRPELCTSTLSAWFGARPDTQEEIAFGDHRCVAVGCLNPFLEYNYSRPSKLWRELIEEHDVHIAIGGTLVIAMPLAEVGVRHLVWCASDVEGDRSDRRRAMPLWRRIVDRYLVTPGLLNQQRAVLGGCGQVLGVSPFTIETLAELSGRQQKDFTVLPIPTDTDFFMPADSPQTLPVLGFAGRLDDPRKNPRLLFQTLATVRARGFDAVLRVTGYKTEELGQLTHEAGVNEHVEFMGVLDREALLQFYRSLRVLIIPSHQEGLAIVGIEAMACGIPVVSTACGGPEAYVNDGENGYLCGGEGAVMGEAVARLMTNDDLHRKFALAARRTAVEIYNSETFRRSVGSELSSLWPYQFSG